MASTPWITPCTTRACGRDWSPRLRPARRVRADVGTNAGYFAMQAKRRGAGRVVGIESVDDYLRQAELCRKI